MSLFSKFTKQSDKVAYPWFQKKCSGPAFPRYGHAVQPVASGDSFIIIGGIAKGSGKKDIFMFDPGTLLGCVCERSSFGKQLIAVQLCYYQRLAQHPHTTPPAIFHQPDQTMPQLALLIRFCVSVWVQRLFETYISSIQNDNDFL